MGLLTTAKQPNFHERSIFADKRFNTYNVLGSPSARSRGHVLFQLVIDNDEMNSLVLADYFQILTLWSSPPEARNWPSREIATARTSLLWPFNR